LEGKHFALLAPFCGILMACCFFALVGIINGFSLDDLRFPAGGQHSAADGRNQKN
jgi:hypothetical protein